jgi:hypothetical protein
MRHILIALAVTFTASTADAQYIIWNSNVPTPGGAYVITPPPFYNGLAFNNGVITAFPVAPRYGYPGFYHPYVNSYPLYPNSYPIQPQAPSSNPYPQIWRP